MYSIGFIEIGQFKKAAKFLKRSYSRYVKKPFNVNQIMTNLYSKKIKVYFYIKKKTKRLGPKFIKKLELLIS
jgi:hypothetical protein